MAEPDTHRLIFLFFSETPERDAAIHALEAFPEAQNAYLGTCDEHSDQAAMWTRNPLASSPADVWRSSSQICHRLATGC